MNAAGLERLSSMVAAGELGRKSGQGFYEWVDGRVVKPAATVQPAKSGNIPDDIQDRLILSMVNEAVACLADCIVSDADLLDVGVVLSTGFAPFFGGPLQYARSRGIDKVTARLEELAALYGERFKPQPGWPTL